MDHIQLVALGVPEAYLSHFEGMSRSEILTNRCECGSIISIHTSAHWRFESHPIRCVNCAKDLQARLGLSWYEARFVV